MKIRRRVFAAAFAAFACAAGGEPQRFSFGGYDWTVKTSERPTAPQNNRFGPLGKNVAVDRDGTLILAIEKGDDGAWRSAEAILGKSLGYGVYEFRTATRWDRLDPSVVAGFFTWDVKGSGARREMDIEFSTWGGALTRANAQYVVQPHDLPGNMDRFLIVQEGDNTSHQMRWERGRVSFASWHGHGERPPAGSPLLIREWTREGSAVPTPGAERIRFNLYLYESVPPESGKRFEMRIREFIFKPLE